METSPIAELGGTAPQLTVHVRRGEPVPLDALFVNSRTRMASELPAQLGCAFDDGPMGPIVRTDGRKETSVPGVYCAGGAARAPHTATWAAADGVTAGVSAHQSLVGIAKAPAR